VVGPPPLATFAHHQRRRIDNALFQPPQKRAFADRKQAGYCCIRESVSCGKVRNHCSLGIIAPRSDAFKHLVTKTKVAQQDDNLCTALEFLEARSWLSWWFYEEKSPPVRRSRSAHRSRRSPSPQSRSGSQMQSAAARIGQSSGSRSPSRSRASTSNAAYTSDSSTSTTTARVKHRKNLFGISAASHCESRQILCGLLEG
jgi:hypothetical protein